MKEILMRNIFLRDTLWEHKAVIKCMHLKKERSENVSTCSINVLFSVTLKSFMANNRTVCAKMHEARNERTKQLNGDFLGSCNLPIVVQRKTGLVERSDPNVFAHFSRPHVRGKIHVSGWKNTVYAFKLDPTTCNYSWYDFTYLTTQTFTTASYNWALRLTYLSLK